jgi:hypothetical protein
MWVEGGNEYYIYTSLFPGELISNVIKNNILSGTVSQYSSTKMLYFVFSSVAEYYAIFKNKQTCIYIKHYIIINKNIKRTYT